MAADATITMKYNADTRAATSNVNTFGSVLRKIGALMGVAFSVQYIKEFARESIAAYREQQEAETKLATVMRQRMNATDEQVQSVKDLTVAQQKLGVIGDELQLAGAQQLATFLNQTDSIETLIPAMNNLAAQQDGVNVTSESMVNIANLMGKALEGNTGALKRVGISFTDAQAEILKYGNESERAAVLAEVITGNVGDMNASLAETDSGKIKQAENAIGDMQEEIGRRLLPVQLQWVSLQKNALIPALGALLDVLGFIAKIVMAVVSAIAFVIEGFKGTNTIATILASALAAVVVVFGTLYAISKAAAIQAAVVNAAETVYIGLLYAKEAAMKVASVAAQAMGVSMNAALGIIGLIIIAVTALIAALISFANNEFSEEANRISGEVKKMNEEFEDGQSKIEGEAGAAEKLTDELIALSKKSNKTAGDIAVMQTKAQMLNKTLGEGTVTVDENTGALKINGQTVDNVEKSLRVLIAAKKEEAAATGMQEAATKAYALEAEAKINLDKAMAEYTFGSGIALKAAADAYIEARDSAKYYGDQLEENVVKEKEATEAAAESMTEEQKRQAIRDELNADRELSTSEHYAKLQEMMDSNYAALGLTEEEYIQQMAEHQQAIEDATQEHVDTLFGINEGGLYNEAQSVEKLNEIWSKNQEDMANYYTNLNALSDAGFTDLARVFEEGGVEMGGSLQNTMDDLQGISLDEWAEIRADWDKNGGKLSANIKKRFGNINVDAGFAVLKLSETTKRGFANAAKYGAGGFEPIAGDVETIYSNVNTAVQSGGQSAAQASAEAGKSAAQSYVSAARSALGNVQGVGRLTGISYVGGLLIGLESRRRSLVSKAISLANSMNWAYRSALDIHSPSGAGRYNAQMYGKGVELGLEDSKKGVEAEAASLADKIVDASKLIYTPPFMGAAGSTSNVYNYYNDNKTDNRQDGPLLNIENYNQNSEQDQQKLARKLEVMCRDNALAKGAKT